MSNIAGKWIHCVEVATQTHEIEAVGSWIWLLLSQRNLNTDLFSSHPPFIVLVDIFNIFSINKRRAGKGKGPSD